MIAAYCECKRAEKILLRQFCLLRAPVPSIRYYTWVLSIRIYYPCALAIFVFILTIYDFLHFIILYRYRYDCNVGRYIFNRCQILFKFHIFFNKYNFCVINV